MVVLTPVDDPNREPLRIIGASIAPYDDDAVVKLPKVFTVVFQLSRGLSPTEQKIADHLPNALGSDVRPGSAEERKWLIPAHAFRFFGDELQLERVPLDRLNRARRLIATVVEDIDICARKFVVAEAEHRKRQQEALSAIDFTS